MGECKLQNNYAHASTAASSASDSRNIHRASSPNPFIRGPSSSSLTLMASVATVMTDVFHKNEINLLRKFAKIMRIFDKIDDPKNRGVI
jgi:hypothetical protein